MAHESEIALNKHFRHKGGKLYYVSSYGREIRWGMTKNPATGAWEQDRSKVFCTQWQVNEKHPKGRPYQAARELKLADLTAAPETENT